MEMTLDYFLKNEILGKYLTFLSLVILIVLTMMKKKFKVYMMAKKIKPGTIIVANETSLVDVN